MKTIEIKLMMSDKIAKNLADGTYERVGGIIRESRSKQIVAWLRELSHEINYAQNNHHDSSSH